MFSVRRNRSTSSIATACTSQSLRSTHRARRSATCRCRTKAASPLDASPTEPGLRFGLDSWTRSIALFSYDAARGTVTGANLIAKDPSDVSHIVAHEVTAPSTDGASVPITIITRDNIVLDGSHPMLFEGYGAYGIALDPAFSASQLEWVRRGLDRRKDDRAPASRDLERQTRPAARDFDAGYGIGSSRTQQVAERADEWTFLLWQLGDPAFQPK